MKIDDKRTGMPTLMKWDEVPSGSVAQHVNANGGVGMYLKLTNRAGVSLSTSNIYSQEAMQSGGSVKCYKIVKATIVLED